MTNVGPVSQALEREVANDLRHQRIVVWLDKDETYADFVDRLADRSGRLEFPHPVVSFRGSFLELLFIWSPTAGASTVNRCSSACPDSTVNGDHRQ